MSRACPGLILGCLGASWADLEEVLEAREVFLTTFSRFQAILGFVLGRANLGPPPNAVFWGPWGRLRGGKYRRDTEETPQPDAPPQGRGWRIWASLGRVLENKNIIT